MISHYFYKFNVPKALQHAVIYGTSIAFMKGISLLMLPFITSQISTAEYGKLEIISSLALIGSVIIGMGLEQTLFRFVGLKNSIIDKKRMAAEIFGIAICIFVISFTAGCIFTSTLSSYLPGNISNYDVFLLLAVLALEGCISIPLGWLRMNEMVTTFFLATTGRATLQALLTCILLLSDRGISGILEAGLIATTLQAIFLFYKHIQTAGISFSGKTTKTILFYSIPIVISGLLAFALNGYDRWLLADSTSLQDTAHYGVASKLALAVVLLFQPFGMWWMPKRFSVLHSLGGRIRVANTIAMGTAILLMISSSVVLLSPAIVDSLFPFSYQVSKDYLFLIIAIMFFRELTELYNIGCFVGSSTHKQLIINAVSSISAIVLMLLLVDKYQVYGVIISLLFAQLLRFVLFYIASQKMMYVHYPLAKILRLFFLSTVSLSLGMTFLKDLYWPLYAIMVLVLQIFYAKSLGLITIPHIFPRNKVTCTQ